MAGSNILRIIYGVEVKSENDPNLALVEEGVKILSKFANAGSYLGNVSTLSKDVLHD